MNTSTHAAAYKTLFWLRLCLLLDLISSTYMSSSSYDRIICSSDAVSITCIQPMHAWLSTDLHMSAQPSWQFGVCAGRVVYELASSAGSENDSCVAVDFDSLQSDVS